MSVIQAPLPASGLTAVTDHVLHGLITIRLVGAPPSVAAGLISLLGPSNGAASGEPDVLIRYVDRLPPAGMLRYIGLHESAYDDSHFYLVDQHLKRVAFDFEKVGQPIELVCERGASVFPYLEALVSLRLLQKGFVLLHGSSFVFRGKGIVATGWQKGGKTETLLSFMAAGAKYMADEWTILSPKDGQMWGLSATVKVWDWHLRCLPQYWHRLRKADRYRLRFLRAYQLLYRRLPRSLLARSPAAELFHRLSVDGDLSLHVARLSPPKLFGDSLWRGPAPIDLVVFAGVGGNIGVTPVEPLDVARRMVASLAHERRSLGLRYRQFRFAFPNRGNDHIESASERESVLLAEAMQGRPAYEILHPYPVDLHALREACLPLVRSIS